MKVILRSSLLLALVFGWIQNGFLRCQNFTYQSVVAWQAPDDHEIFSIDRDEAGNLYVAGNFKSIADIDPGPNTVNLTASSAFGDGYLAKFDSSGTFLWVWQMPGESSDDQINDIFLEPGGDVILTGAFRNTVDFDPGPGTFNLTATGGNTGGADIFIAKFDAMGGLIFARQAGGLQTDIANDMAVDPQGNIYIGGMFSDVATFGTGGAAVQLTAIDEEDGFLAKYDPNGGLTWVDQLGGADGDFVLSLSLTSEYSIVAGGLFRQSIDLDPSGILDLHSSNGDNDAWLAVYDGNGNLEWGFTIGGAGNDYFTELAVDREDQIIAAGVTDGTIDLDPEEGTELHSTNATFEAFVVRYSRIGDHLYSFSLDATSPGLTMISNIETDGYGQYYVLGVFKGATDLDPGSGVLNVNADFREIFLSKYSLDGKLRWGYEFDADGSSCRSHDLLVEEDGDAVIAGSLVGTVHLNPTSSNDSLSSMSNNWNPFIADYNQCISVYPGFHSLCPDEQYSFGSQTIVGSGAFVETFPQGNGCDSIVELLVSETPVDISITKHNDHFTANAINATFQWLSCPTLIPISNETNSSFYPPNQSNFEFAVEVTQNGCVDTSECSSLILSNSQEPNLSINPMIWPQPASEQLNLRFPEVRKVENMTLFNLQGKGIRSEAVSKAGTDFSMVLTDIPDGVYLLLVRFEDGSINRTKISIVR